MSSEASGSYRDEILGHIPDEPAVLPSVDPDTLDREVEAVSADGQVRATVSRRTLEITSIRIETLDDTSGPSVVEAVNAALTGAEAGAQTNLEEAMATRMAELDAALDRTNRRLDELSDEIDVLLAEPTAGA